MALSAGDSFFAGSPGSWRQTAYAVSSALPQSILGSRRPLAPGGMVSSVSSGSPVVAPPSSPLSRCVPPPGVSRHRLLVRRLRRWVGCSSWSPRRFRPLEPWPGVSVNQRQGAAGNPTRSPTFSAVSARPYSRSVLRQRHCSSIPPQGGGHQVSLAEQHCSGDPASVGVSRHPSGSAVHSGLEQHPGDALSCPHQLPHSEWSLNMTMFWSLCCLWPVQIDLFGTSANHSCSIYFLPYRDPHSAGTDTFLQSWDGLQAYAFPLFAIIPRVLAKLRESRGTELTLVAPHWAQHPWFPDLLQLSLAPPVVLPDRPDLLRLPQSRLLYPGLHRLSLLWRAVCPHAPFTSSTGLCTVLGATSRAVQFLALLWQR